jgi:hypothetical protein
MNDEATVEPEEEVCEEETVEDLITEFTFPLTKPVPYAFQGDQLKAGEIKLFAPSSIHSRQCAALKQAFFRSLPKNIDADSVEVDEAKSTDIGGKEIIIMLAMSNDVDLASTFEIARDLFSTGDVAMLDGQAPMKKIHTQKMSQLDWERMIGEYLANFILASVLIEMNEQKSKRL